MIRHAGLAAVLSLAALVHAAAWQAGGVAAAAPLPAAIDQLGSLDFAARSKAVRTVRATPAEVAVPALVRAAQGHPDGYVRYRALVLLSGFGGSAAGQAMRQLMGDANDRIREVTYEWFEHHPEPSVIEPLVAALTREQSEFVRPALTRALAAQGADPRVRSALLPLVTRGADFFRAGTIEALGDYHAAYATSAIADVARLEGPLQEEAVVALGKIGDPAMLPVVLRLEDKPAGELQPAIAVARCLLGDDCAAQQTYLTDTLRFAAGTDGYQPLLRATAHACAVLALAGKPEMLSALFDQGDTAKDPARAPIALAVGLVALRNPGATLDRLEARADRNAAIDLLRDAFDMLSAENFEQERFYAAVRDMYWAAPAGSAKRQFAQLLLDRFEF